MSRCSTPLDAAARSPATTWSVASTATVYGSGPSCRTRSSRFPPGIPVGTAIVPANPQVGFSLIASVAPAVEVTRLDFVKVIVGWDPLDARFGVDDEPEPGSEESETPAGQDTPE